MLLSARPRKLPVVAGLCAGVICAAATAGTLAVLDDEPVAPRPAPVLIEATTR